jgi:uncharacterized protein (TIGR03032 family)
MNSAESGAAPPAAAPRETYTAVNYEHTPGFVPLLEQSGVSLLVTTYQAGKLFTVGTHRGEIAFGFYNFEQAMGVAVKPGRIAVGTRRQIWFLRSAQDIAPRVAPAGKYDACFLTRSAHFTGLIHGHELAWAGDELWVVNTLFSCLCTIQDEFSFVPRWRPRFVSALAAEDRCHLNGLAMEGGRPRYVTAMGETDTAGGWRAAKATGGVLIDVPANATVARGFAMPHSPRIHDGRVWVLDSGHGRLSLVDPGSGKAEPVAHLQGYTRGLDFHGPYAFVGLSKIRETSVFGGLPIAEERDRLRCGVAVVDLRSGKEVAGLWFHNAVDEVFAVQVLPGVRCPVVSGPLPDADGTQTIWLAPQPPGRA